MGEGHDGRSRCVHDCMLVQEVLGDKEGRRVRDWLDVGMLSYCPAHPLVKGTPESAEAYDALDLHVNFRDGAHRQVGWPPRLQKVWSLLLLSRWSGAH